MYLPRLAASLTRGYSNLRNAASAAWQCRRPVVRPLPRLGQARCPCRQLTLQHPHERHARLRKDPAVEADLDRGRRHRRGAAQDARLLSAGDEVEGVDAADAAVAVPELDLEAFGRPGDVEVEQVAVALDEDGRMWLAARPSACSMAYKAWS